ncbi:MAG: RluA family pseudouridine synthase, partial [Candidatus Gastranaerophilales bacterium]|nr:RluA family pseudouridine synthase [Candidatus Gastranaerophilales bacterium]
MTNNLISCEIEEQDTGKRIDLYLSEFLKDFSRSRVQKLIRDENSIKVNSLPVKNSYNLKFGDVIEITLPDLIELELKPQDLNLNIIYENDDFLIVNKPFGMLTHPTSVERENTLVNGLLYHCKDNLSGINGVLRPGIVHRLDRDTSGLLVVAKNDFAHNNLAKQIKEKTAMRNYLTVVCGNIKDNEGIIDLPIDRSKTEKCKMAVSENGKPSVTHYKVLERFGDYTYLEVSLKTGRTHQIRVHFSYLKHPVYGDRLYGGGNVKVNTTAQVLQAYKLSLDNPKTNERMTFEIPLDE